jgi:hypothetical protein
MDYRKKAAVLLTYSTKFARTVVSPEHSAETPFKFLHSLPEKLDAIQEKNHKRSLFPKEDHDRAMPHIKSIDFVPKDGHLNAKTPIFPSRHRN